ncbi:GNAT family N-acetyltransferase [Sphingomonas parva]|uniref:GNAT family N-acetyltransferase n=1 Tax=Sphingomonas parva TaxID=2555898 RepID=A0A4Y8ZV22_9SPHN|nr:GNAT family N-acetyltransferase [Sphingomonas parva]TFI58599.1 GNAT family N-acetyltransferase [Sphingomonas parva]
MQQVRRLTPAGAAIDVRAVEGFGAEIDAAAARADSRHLFLRRAWYAASERPGARTLIACRADGSIVAALPTLPGLAGALREVPGGYWPFRSFPIASDLGDDELGALLASPPARRVLGPVWRIGPVYADDPTLVRLLRVCRGAGWTALPRRIAPSFRLDMAALRREGTWPRGSTLKKNRFHEKHLASHGALEWRFVSGSDWTPALFEALAEVERKSWIASETDGSDAKFMAPQHRRIWEGAARDPVLARAMRAAILSVDGTPAAFSFDLDAGALKYAIANSYDPRLAKHSPGKCLYYRNLVEALDRGIETVDWGAGDSGYKRTIGAEPGPDLVDVLFVRRPIPAALLGPLWRASGR